MASSSSSSSNHGTWSDLPDNLLYSILILLPSIRDLLVFSSVCRSWRSLASSTVSPSPVSFFPPLLLHLFFVRLSRRRRRIVPSDFLLIDPSSSEASLSKVNSCNRSPIEAQSILTLPFISSSHGHLLFFSNYHRQILIVDFITGHRVEVVSPLCPVDSELPFCLASLTAPLSSPCSSLLLLTRNSLFVWRVGAAEWIRHSLDVEIKFASDMTIVGNRIYAMDKFTNLFSINMPPELRVERHSSKFLGNCDWFFTPSHRLVDRCGELLCVCFLADKAQEYSNNITITVFRVDFSNEQPELVKIENLGNWALFVNADRRVAGFACKNPERWGGKSNCIYYSGLGNKGTWFEWRLDDVVSSEILCLVKSKFYNADEKKWPDQIWAYPNVLSEVKSADQILLNTERT